MSEKDLIIEEDGSVTEETKPVTTDPETSKRMNLKKSACFATDRRVRQGR